MSKRNPLCLAGLLFVLIAAASELRPAANNFRDDQLRFERVRAAVQEKEAVLKSLFAQKAVPYPPRQIFIRAFKEEKVLELWARGALDKPFTLIKAYDICSLSGGPGPKRREGDFQVPEGFYVIDQFNPFSIFHLSLRINYPNASDRILSDPDVPGGEIFIHGNCVSIGCLPLTDDKIKEVYLVALEAKSGGQERIPVHIFPLRLSQTNMDGLKDRRIRGEFPAWPEAKAPGGKGADLIAFWENLKEGYELFEQTKTVPQYSVEPRTGKYLFIRPSP